MRALVGLLALLVAVAVVGVVSVRQWKTQPATRSPVDGGTMVVVVPASSRDAARQITHDIDQAMQAASAARERAGEP